MDETTAAQRMEALGHPKRLAIFRLLVRAGYDGLVVGAVQRTLDIPASTLSHHLSWLARVGLIAQDRQGREIHCRAAFDEMTELVAFLTDECCAGGAGETSPQPAETA